MKKFSVLLISFILLACSSDSLYTQKDEKTVSVSNKETFELLLASAIPIEGGYSIFQQAEHFAVSEIQYRNEGIFYVYTPEEGFTGADLVKIKRADSNGATIYSETITVLDIKVTE